VYLLLVASVLPAVSMIDCHAVSCCSHCVFSSLDSQLSHCCGWKDSHTFELYVDDVCISIIVNDAHVMYSR